MRYIYYILSISVIITVLTALAYFNDRKPHGEVALRINDRVITTHEFDNEFEARPYHILSREEFVESIITKELLIQEARKEKIDLDESFRRSLKDFYEQSLTKSLLDRKLDSFKISVSEEEVAAYLKLADMDISMTLITQTPDGKAEVEKQLSGPFQSFSTPVRMAIVTLAVEETSGPLQLADNIYHIRLDSALPGRDNTSDGLTTVEVRTMITEYKRQTALQEWIEDLRSRATITETQAQ